jgi:hypothetical protein
MTPPLNDPTGSHPLPTAGLTLDLRTVGLGVLLLLGGGAGGIGTTVLGGSGVKEELAGLRADVAGMRSDMQANKTADIYIERERAEMRTLVNTHEARLDALEKKGNR